MNHRLLIGYTLLLILIGCRQEETVRNKVYPIQGLDVSHHQGFIQWDSIQMNNFQFVFIKATEGANFVDSNYLKNYNGARSRGMKVGAYHFFRPQVPGTIQAEHFLENSIICPGDLLPVLDVETTDAVQADQLKQEIQAFIDIVVDSIGVNPIIYTYQNFFNDHLDVAHADENLWIARYNKRYNPELKEAAEWHFWQYGQHGKVPGINAYVDFNVFCCDSSEFQYFTVPPFTADSLATY